jgi:hypothetical protein
MPIAKYNGTIKEFSFSTIPEVLDQQEHDFLLHVYGNAIHYQFDGRI